MAGHGRNAGITGIIDFPASGVKFQVTLSAWAQSGEVTTRGRVGRGSGRWAKARRVLSSGNLVCTGRVRRDAYPIPTTFEGVEGQVVIALDATRTVTCQIRVTAYKLTLPEDEASDWKVNLTAEITAMPVFAGFTGTQPTFTLPTLADQQLYEGLTKGLDPSDLQSTATQTIDVWAVGDTDSAERSEMATLIAAAIAPLTGLKLRAVNLLSGRDADGCQFQLVWGRTSTAEDVINARARKSIDVSALGSQVAVAAINGTPAAPTEPELVKATTATETLNDGNTVTTETWTDVTPQEQLEYSNSPRNDDAGGLADVRRYASLTDSSTPPSAPVVAGLKLRGWDSVRQTHAGKWLHTAVMARRDTIDDAEMDGSDLLDDVGGLRSKDQQTLIDASSTPPAAPAARDADLIHVRTQSRQRHDDAWVHTYFYDYGTSADAVSWAAYRALRDVDDMDGGGALVEISDSATPGVAPATPVSGSKHVRTESTRDEGSGKYLHVFLYAITSAKDRLEYEGWKVRRDPSGMVQSASYRSVTTSATPPATPATPLAGLVYAGLLTERQTEGGKYVHTFEYAIVTNLTAKENEGYAAAEDPGTIALVRSAVVRVVDATETPGTPPSSPVSGLVHAGTDTTVDAKSGKFAHDFRYAPLTNQDAELAEGSEDTVDASGLGDAAVMLVITTTSSVPTTPTPTDATLVLTGRKTKRRRDGRWNHSFVFGRLTATQEQEIRASAAVEDPIRGPSSGLGTLTTVDPADTEAEIAEDAASAVRDELDFDGVEVKRITRTKAMVIIRRAGGDKIVETRGFHTRYDLLKGYASDGVIGTTTAGVRVAALLDGNGHVGAPILLGGYTAARLDYRQFLRTTGDVILTRRIIVDDESDVTAALHADAEGYVNDGTFLGRPTDTLMFGGSDLITRWDLIGGGHLLFIRYVFHYDSLGFPNEQNLDVGPVSTDDPSTLINTIGLVQADDYFGANWLLSWPGDWDMDVFLA